MNGVMRFKKITKGKVYRFHRVRGEEGYFGANEFVCERFYNYCVHIERDRRGKGRYTWYLECLKCGLHLVAEAIPSDSGRGWRVRIKSPFSNPCKYSIESIL